MIKKKWRNVTFRQSVVKELKLYRGNKTDNPLLLTLMTQTGPLQLESPSEEAAAHLQCLAQGRGLNP